MVSFSERLKTLRQELGLSQDQLSMKLNIPRTTISSWELGRRSPDISTIINLSNFFNTTTDYLLGKIDIRHPCNLEIINRELISLIELHPEFETFILQLTSNEKLQAVCSEIQLLSDSSLIRLSKIIKAVEPGD